MVVRTEIQRHSAGAGVQLTAACRVEGEGQNMRLSAGSTLVKFNLTAYYQGVGPQGQGRAVRSREKSCIHIELARNTQPGFVYQQFRLLVHANPSGLNIAAKGRPGATAQCDIAFGVNRAIQGGRGVDDIDISQAQDIRASLPFQVIGVIADSKGATTVPSGHNIAGNRVGWRHHIGGG